MIDFVSKFRFSLNIWENIFYSPCRYEMVRVTENILEPQPEKRGLLNYLWDQVE